MHRQHTPNTAHQRPPHAARPTADRVAVRCMGSLGIAVLGGRALSRTAARHCLEAASPSPHPTLYSPNITTAATDAVIERRASFASKATRWAGGRRWQLHHRRRFCVDEAVNNASFRIPVMHHRARPMPNTKAQWTHGRSGRPALRIDCGRSGVHCSASLGAELTNDRARHPD